MKIIFLDIDGVLNSSEYFAKNVKKILQTQGNLDNDKMWAQHICSDLVQNLNKIIEKTNAKVVVSSSWRLRHGHQKVARFLNERGFQGEVIGETPSKMSNCQRYMEIYWWLDGNKEMNIEKYIILDDIKNFDFLQTHLVHTHPRFGLTEAKVQEAIKLLSD